MSEPKNRSRKIGFKIANNRFSLHYSQKTQKTETFENIPKNRFLSLAFLSQKKSQPISFRFSVVNFTHFTNESVIIKIVFNRKTPNRLYFRFLHSVAYQILSLFWTWLRMDQYFWSVWTRRSFTSLNRITLTQCYPVLVYSKVDATISWNVYFHFRWTYWMVFKIMQVLLKAKDADFLKIKTFQ